MVRVDAFHANGHQITNITQSIILPQVTHLNHSNPTIPLRLNPPTKGEPHLDVGNLAQMRYHFAIESHFQRKVNNGFTTIKYQNPLQPNLR